MKVLTAILMTVFVLMSVAIIGCGGGDAVSGEITGRCKTSNWGLNDKGAIIVYPGDYIHILNYRCEDCHKVEHRPNP